MANTTNRRNMLYPLGLTVTDTGAEILVQTEAEQVTLVLFRAGEKEYEARYDFREEDRIGDVWTMSLTDLPFEIETMEYGFLADGEWMVDPYAKALSGRNVWGSAGEAEQVRGRIPAGGFSWDDDKNPGIPYADTIIYRLHVRGFTKHESSHARNKGTFAGIIEMMPYFKSLGVTTIEFMPAAEFDEVMRDEVPAETPGGKPVLKPNGKLNYWGYAPAYLYAPKASYGTGRMPVEMEFKIMVKELHREGLECIPELYFTGDESIPMVLDVLRYWVQEYHVDGFRLSGPVPLDVIAEDPFLKHVKLIAGDWKPVLQARKQKNGRTSGAPKAQAAGPVGVRQKNLAVCNDDFRNAMRKVLKGDQGMVPELIEWTGKNPEDHAVINYMADNNGFTMMDMVSYNEKHNEANGEDNLDGSFENLSWNCGIEGPTDVPKVMKLRKQQLYNAFLLLLLSQGTPMIQAGDEFGNTQFGNNNAYCQDNETGWIDWNQLEEHADLFSVVQEFIRFRKEHKLFHMDHAAKHADYRSLGCPDVSYHGQAAWKVDQEPFRKQLGIMYWGAYGTTADGNPDTAFYVAYNFHWGTHKLGLPRLPRGVVWKPLYDTSGGEAAVRDRIYAQIPPYTVVVFAASEETGYCTYNLPIGELTLVCRKGELTDACFGRMVPTDIAEMGLPEEHLEVLDKAYKQLKEYFVGDRKEFDLPISAEGTEFQQEVWEALRTIPYGETRSYKDIAVQIGKEGASRAVGMANNRNPLPIFIPCHRVISADGTMGGYGGGEEIKKQLLDLEQMYKEQ